MNLLTAYSKEVDDFKEKYPNRTYSVFRGSKLMALDSGIIITRIIPGTNVCIAGIDMWYTPLHSDLITTLSPHMDTLKYMC